MSDVPHRVKILQSMLDGRRKAPAADLIALAYKQGYEQGRADRQREVEGALFTLLPSLAEQGQ